MVAIDLLIIRFRIFVHLWIRSISLILPIGLSLKIFFPFPRFEDTNISRFKETYKRHMYLYLNHKAYFRGEKIHLVHLFQRNVVYIMCGSCMLLLFDVLRNE